MQELFGPVTGFGVATLVTLLTQLVKSYFKFQDLQALVISLAVAIVWFMPFHLLWADQIDGRVVYEAIFYAFMGWLLANGIYSAGKTVVKTVQG